MRYVSVHLTAIERLRGERMCANSGRTYADSAQETHRQWKSETAVVRARVRQQRHMVRPGRQ